MDWDSVSCATFANIEFLHSGTAPKLLSDRAAISTTPAWAAAVGIVVI